MPGYSRASRSAFGWWSSRPFLLGLVAAGIFVLTRTLYTALFGGLSAIPANQTVVWVLPQVWLPGPFSSIHIFGVMTGELLLTAIVAALSFAAVIVAFGLLSSLVDLRVALRSAPRWLSGVSTALVIAVGVFTTFAEMAKRLATARILRGERSRMRTLVPLLEQSIERAEWMGLSMASRGWGVHADSARLLGEPSVSMTGVTVRVGDRVLLEDVNLALQPGTVTVLTGATGSGKTTLLQVIRGYATNQSDGIVSVEGTCQVFGAAPKLAQPVGLTSQHPELSFVAPTVREELAFGALQNELDVAAAVDRAATQAGITRLLDRRVDQLSAGEQAVVAIAAACTAQPRILLLDEPIADLDERATEYVVCVLRELRAAGVTVLVAEHRSGALSDVADQWLRIESRRITAGVPVAGTAARAGVAPRVNAADESLGQVIVLEGPNGSGKTTLLTSLALQGRRAVTSVAMVPHRVDDLFFAASVAAECERAHTRNGVSGGVSSRDRILGFLPAFDSFDLNPRDCSAGTRVVIAISLQLSLGRNRLILDEPTRGLDATARAELVCVIRALAAQGIQIIVATHDAEFASEVGDARVRMRDATLLDGVITDGWIAPRSEEMRA